MSLTMNNNSYWMVVNGEGSDGAPVKVDCLNVKKGHLHLRALNHKLRPPIQRLLDENKKLTVTEIYVHLRLEQSVASQHLAILRRAGIVKTQRDGKFIYYIINHDRLSEIMKCVDALLDSCQRLISAIPPSQPHNNPQLPPKCQIT